jgi:DNA (cytosine-5)-methyltransferase 1
VDRVYVPCPDPALVSRLTAVDLFCGGGGLTEGFKQVGIDVRACLDIWGPAVETHRKNHPETEVFQADILEFEPSDLPHCDVLIGSPPCTEFSYANRGGHGDLGLGMRFVLRFLRFVHELEPRYWVMENVPRLYQSLPSRVSLRRLGLPQDGHLEIPVRRILNSADYGVPQKRLRLVSGKYPIPEPTHTWADELGAFTNLQPWVPVKTVVGTLPDPLHGPDLDSVVRDPCFNLELAEANLTDHFMDTRLSEEEIAINRKTKTDHSWYGRMSFPDPIDRPARTVMATQTGVSRETLVLEGKVGEESYFRRPTIRECASFQSFPITYQFWGSTAQTRYKVVGNAVPPLMAGAIAQALLRKENLPIPRELVLSREVREKPPALTPDLGRGRARVHVYPQSRKFRDHIPGSKGQGVRVDFANVVTTGDDGAEGIEVRWEARLIVGSGKSVTTTIFSLERALELLEAWPSSTTERTRVGSFLSRLQSESRTRLTDAESLQAAWTRRLPTSEISPPLILDLLGRLVNDCFPSASFRGILVRVPAHSQQVGRGTVPIRTAAQLVAAAFVAESVMRGGKPSDLAEVLNRTGLRVAFKKRRRAILA